MQSNGISKEIQTGESQVSFKTRSGTVEKGVVGRATRFEATFTVYGPAVVLEISEALNEFQLSLDGKVVYAGRAVVKAAMPEGGGVMCAVTLDPESWIDVSATTVNLAGDFREFMTQASRRSHITHEFKLVVSDMQDLINEMRCWAGKLELDLAKISSPPERARAERAALDQVRPVALPLLHGMFERFEDAAKNVPLARLAEHAAYVKRILHPLVLCSPFMHRTFAKPLGYAGDYEMVAMMARDPYEGASTFAKLMNTYFLDTSPVVAHRQRLLMLTEVLFRESCRARLANKRMSIFNLGCGPAWEIRDFMAQQEVSNVVDFTLLDFNAETVTSTGQACNDQARRHGRATTFKMVHKSVTQLLKDATRPGAAGSGQRYDVVYCAGLFDYLNDVVCEKLVEVFYQLVAPGGLVMVTNVDNYNPCRNWMELAVDWHLIYRNAESMRSLIPAGVNADDVVIRSDLETGVNIFLEIRKPHAGLQR